LCKKLGIEEKEIGCASSARRPEVQEEKTYSIFLFDNAAGGAGYATQAPNLLPVLFREARLALDCPAECDSACQVCVLDNDTQHHIDDLDRHRAIAWLSDEFLDALDLPRELQVFGEQTRLELESLSLALKREWQRQPGHTVRVYWAGAAEHWESLA
jgi:DEAD/DEAH box helicase domain-containing protein